MQSPVEPTSETESLARLVLWVDERDFDATVVRHAKTLYVPAHWVVTLSSGGLSLREEGSTLEAALARAAGRLRQLGVEPSVAEPSAQNLAPEPSVAILEGVPVDTPPDIAVALSGPTVNCGWVVRFYDSFDHEWCDVGRFVGQEAAELAARQKTAELPSGNRSCGEYYRAFPADTRMFFSEEGKRDFALTRAADSARTAEFRSAEDPRRWLQENET